MSWRDDLRASVDRAATYRERWGTLPTLTGAVKLGATSVHDAVRDLSRNLRQAETYGVPRRVAITAYRRGVSVKCYRWLALDERDPDAAVLTTDAFEAVNGAFAPRVDNKHLFHRLTAHTGALPVHYGTIRDGQFRPVETGRDPGDGVERGARAEPNTAHDGVPALLDEVGKLVLKPVDGGRGDGVLVVEPTGSGVAVDGEPHRPAAFERRLAALDDYLVDEYVTQHGYAERVFPGATNTLRILSVVDPETGAPAVVRAAHRFGSAASRPIDNWSKGGYCAPVDVETGTVGDLVLVDRDGRRRSATHPDTGAEVGGVEVPGWDAVLDTVESVAAVHDRVPIVGWDVLVTDDGPVVIEGNATPAVELLHLNAGLLEEDAVARVLRDDG